MLGFVNKLFISVQRIVFLVPVLLPAELVQKFKIAVWRSDSMKRNFRGFTFTTSLTAQETKENLESLLDPVDKILTMNKLGMRFSCLDNSKAFMGNILVKNCHRFRENCSVSKLVVSKSVREG